MTSPDAAGSSAAAILAYDLPERVARYDRDMEIMHPNRGRMIDALLDVAAQSGALSGETIQAVDLGVGTGMLALRLLQRFPRARLLAIDGAAAMLDLARTRLAPVLDRVTFVQGDFRDLSTLLASTQTAQVDVVASSFALHHLSSAEKAQTLSEATHALRPGGWLLNADLVVAAEPSIEALIQRVRVAGIVERARTHGDAPPHFLEAAATRDWLDAMEAREGDQPLTLAEDLALAAAAGLLAPSLFWQDGRETVWGGPRSG